LKFGLPSQHKPGDTFLLQIEIWCVPPWNAGIGYDCELGLQIEIWCVPPHEVKKSIDQHTL
jgi:hypothetical protein